MKQQDFRVGNDDWFSGEAFSERTKRSVHAKFFSRPKPQTKREKNLEPIYGVPSRAIILSGRLRVRVFCPSPDSELMDFLAEPEEKLRGSEELGWKSGRREVEIKEVVGSRRGSKKEVKEGMCLSRSGGSNSVASSSSTFVQDSELSGTGRRPAGDSLVGYSNSKNITKFDAAIVAEEEVREVYKYVDDSW
ncbi:hypothetical protein KSP39_PZI000987 [Platanthera zijinensis]|uniref:Uncharacterized protein n=1 Tax=Platanthera zijinensis TaxID=2320716 RepID=A0AAP0C494_9ASPA